MTFQGLDAGDALDQESLVLSTAVELLVEPTAPDRGDDDESGKRGPDIRPDIDSTGASSGDGQKEPNDRAGKGLSSSPRRLHSLRMGSCAT